MANFKKKVYFISGLGADSRSFSFLDLSFCEPCFIEWVSPLPRDTLASYAARLFEKIQDEEATIVGLSFGGMLATEMAKAHPATRVIIISSAKTYFEIPHYLRFWRHFPIYKLHSHKIKNAAFPFILKIIGTKGKQQTVLQKQILHDSQPSFTRWAMNAIVNWTNTLVPTNITHIHGTADKLLPFRYVKADIVIPNGEHVLLMDEHEQVSDILKKLITE